jgi:hypothetical protein
MAINPLSYSDIGPTAVDKINGNLGALQSEADALSAQLTAEQQARQAADQQQAGAVAQAQQAINSAVQTLQGEISAETQTRSQAIATLGQQVTGEAQARSGGDAAEAQARTAADNELAAEIAAERDARGKADTAEATARALGDQQTMDAVATEAAARGAAISAEAAARGAAISAEAQARAVVAADLVALGSRLDAADAKEAAARQAVSDALFQETQARTALASHVDSVVNDAVTASDTVAASVVTEAAARTEGDAAEATARQADVAALRLLGLAASRPGDVPPAFTSDLSLLVSELPSSFASVLTSSGRKMRISGAGVLAQVALQPVQFGRLLKIHAVARRYVDTLDPAGDAVGLFLAWYGADRALLPVQTRIAIALLTVAGGPLQLGALVSPDIGDATTLRPPAGAAYLRPFVQVWGETPVTDVEVIETADVTDYGGVSVDLDDVVNRLANVEAVQASIPATVADEAFLDALIFG